MAEETPPPADAQGETVELPGAEAAGEAGETPPPADAQGETVELPDAEAAETVELAVAETVLTGGESEHVLAVAPESPETIGRYEVRGLLGSGGMGRVYRAFHPGLERDVALKLLTAHGNPEHTRRFELEARAAARLKHPHIVAIHDVGTDDGRPFLVMDLIEGRSLADRLEEGRLDPREAAALTRDVARALAHAHSHMVLHRDIKPGNIMLTVEGEPRLTDFGLAKDLSADAPLTETGVIMGTPAYMPPEQARGALEAIDRRADVYALGATLYEMLTGAPPFTGESALSVIHKLLRNEPVAPRTLRPELDLDLETICLRCLEKEPDARYATASDLADDLGRFLAHETITARPPTPPERVRKWVRRNRTLARAVSGTVAGAALVGLIGTIAFVLSLARARERAEEARQLAEVRRVEADEARALAEQRASEARSARQLAEERAIETAEQARLARDSLDTLIYEVRYQLADLPGEAVRRARVRLLEKALAGLLRLDPSDAGERRVAEVSRQQAEIALLLGRLKLADEASAGALASLPPSERPGDRLERSRLLLVRSGIRGRQGRLDDAVTAGRAAEAEAVRAGEGASGEIAREARTERVRCLVHLGGLLRRQGKLTTARSTLEAARKLAGAGKREDERALYQGVLSQLSQLCMTLGDLEAAKAAGLEALALARARHEKHPERLSSGVLLASQLNGLGGLCQEQEQIPEALAHFTEALGLARGLAQRDPRDTKVAKECLQALSGTARGYERTGRRAEALALHKEALGLARRLLALDDSDWAAREALVVSLLALGSAQYAQWALASAEATFAEAGKEAARLVAHDPSDVRVQTLEIGAAQYGGKVALHLGKVEASLRSAQHAVKASRALLARDPKLAAAGRSLAVGLGQLGAIHERRAEEARSLAYYLEASQEIRRLIAVDPSHARLKRNLAAALATAGDLHHRAGRLPQAELALGQACEQLAALRAEAPTERAADMGGINALLQRVTAERLRLDALKGGAPPASPIDHWLLARDLAATDPVRAVTHFEEALRDPRLRRQPQPSVIAFAARAAARASAATQGEARATHRARALAWLTEHVTRYRAMIGQFSQALRQPGRDPREQAKYLEVRDKLQGQLRQLAIDPAFAGLREDAGFKTLFPEVAGGRSGR